MVRTLRESKAKLSELVERASKGEDVFITVRGQVKARLTQVAAKPALSNNRWADEILAHHHAAQSRSKSKPKLTIQQVLDEIREDRV